MGSLYIDMLRNKERFISHLRDHADKNIQERLSVIFIGTKKNGIVLTARGKASRIIYRWSRKWYSMKKKLGVLRCHRTDYIHPIFMWSNYRNDSCDRRFLIWSKLSGDELRRHLTNEFESTCQHEYDCCGNWYSIVYHSLTRSLGWGFKKIVISYQRNI